MAEPLARLIEALARQDAEDYLREIAANDGAETGPAENPVLPAADKAA